MDDDCHSSVDQKGEPLSLPHPRRAAVFLPNPGDIDAANPYR